MTGPSEALSTYRFVGTNESTYSSSGTASGGVFWTAVQTWPRYEKKAAAELEKKNLEVFLPLVASERQWSDRRKIVQLPLFASYLFVKTPATTDTRISVLRTNGVIKFVGSGNTGTPIPDGEIESVRTLVTRGVPYQNHTFLNIGQRVRIRGGSLDGVEGVLIDKNDDLSLVVSIQLIQRSLAVRVAGYRIEAAQS